MSTVALSTQRRRVHADLKSLLVGEFELRREIVMAEGDRYYLDGAASFSMEEEDEIAYVESGVLSSSTASFDVSRSYRYHLNTSTSASVRFADGSLFHELEFTSGRCRVTHLCGDDLYSGLIVVRDADLLTRWRCRGPKKDYVATTRLSRQLSTTAIQQ